MQNLFKRYFQFITLPVDKANHAMHGLIVYSFIAIYSPFIAILVVLVLGIGKEVLDKYIGGTVDIRDIVATALAPVILYLIKG